MIRSAYLICFIVWYATGSNTIEAQPKSLPMSLEIEGQGKPAEASNTPNILVLLVDDLGWVDVGCQGSNFYETPHIDRLATEGVRFTSGYSACSVCSPTRASYLTGKYPHRLKVTNTIDGGNVHTSRVHDGVQTPSAGYLSSDELTLPQLLKRYGYSTYHVGKWHLGMHAPSTNQENFSPTSRGYDVNIGGGHYGAPATFFDPYHIPERPGYKKMPLSSRKKGEYLTDRLTDEAILLLKKHRANKKHEPFFLTMAYYAVHTPIEAPVERVKEFKGKEPHHGQSNATYAAMVSAVDESVGRILELLDHLELADNTLVVFTSDNGGRILSFRESPPPTDNAPLRNGKATGYEGGLRVPWIIRWPGITIPGLVSKEPVITADIFPTLAKAVGATVKNTNQLDGIDIRPALEGKPLKRDALYWHFPHFRRHPDPYSIIQEKGWKLIKTYHSVGPKYELYHLNEDVGESNNLAEKELLRRDHLARKLEAHLKQTGAELPSITTTSPKYQ